MKIKTISLGIFLFCMTTLFLYLFAGEQTVAELRKELQEEHNITAFPLAQTTASIKYVFIGEDTIIRSGLEPGEVLTEYNLRTKGTRSISPPAEWAGRRINSIRDLYYDRTANTLHGTVRERLPSNDTITLYYLLHLDDNSWEEIPELRDIIYHFSYNPDNKLLYIDPMFDEGILVFDMANREFIERIDLLGEATGFYTMYGTPLQILAHTKVEGEYRYYLFDTESRTGKMYPNIEINPEGISLDYYIHIDGQRFLCINGQKQYESDIMELDLIAGTTNVIALKSFPRGLYFLQRVDEMRYSFLTRSDDKWVLLCIMEYH